MAFDMTDPAGLMAVYTSILDNKYNWMLLHYSNDSYDELGLHSYGSEGLEELKTKISNLNTIYIAFYREEVDINPGYILINYIPPTISGVEQAKALVHSRRIGVILKKHQAVFTIEDLSLLTVETVHHVLRNPKFVLLPIKQSQSQLNAASPAFAEPQKGDFFSSTIPPNHDPSPPAHHHPPKPPAKPITSSMARRSFSESYRPHVPVSSGQPPAHHTFSKGGSLFSSILRRKKDPAAVEDLALPPPPPPKDLSRIANYPIQPSFIPRVDIATSPPSLRRQRSHSMSDFAVISHRRDSDEIIVLKPEEPAPSSLQLRPLKGKWAQEGPHSSDPVERARRRREIQLRREEEEKAAVKEEAERQRKLKLEKEAFLQQEREEESRRKMEIEVEVRRITAERRRREQTEREEEEAKRRELEERKRLDRERRLEEHRKLEQWRNDQAKKAEEASREAEEARKQEEAARKRKIQQVEAKIKQAKGDTDLISGWVTILSQDSLSWKRRFYKVTGNTLVLYRNSKDLSVVIDKLELKGKLSGLKEWDEGYEHLKAIAFSFVIEFKDGSEPWSVYADSESEKFKLLGLLKVSGGL